VLPAHAQPTSLTTSSEHVTYGAELRALPVTLPIECREESRRERKDGVPDDACIDPDDVAAWLHSRLEPEALRALEQHVATCTECRELLSALAQAEVPNASGEPDEDIAVASTLPWTEPHPDLVSGACVGRYIIASELGKGAMGVVYAAHDPELDRKVALKILRTGGFVSSGQELLRERLRREAQAMAQLAHPNVVTVHDVGTVHDHIFIAMELVEGQTLASWLTASPRSWHAVVGMFLAAGKGLAAAHAAGIVHRDFKPENVLVGNDGRVRVGDFGLARILALEVRDGSDERPGQADTNASGTTDLLVGTPYFMAPEQFLCRATDARSDQFSFCLALYAAIARQHPFGGDDVKELAAAVVEGRLRPPPGRSVLPRRVLRLLLRGVATDPGDRYPSMDALLAELGREHAKRRPVGAAVVAITIAIAIVGVIAGAEIVGRSETEHRPSDTEVAMPGEGTHDAVAVDVGTGLRADAKLGDQSTSASTAAPLDAAPRAHGESVTTLTQPEMFTDWYHQGARAYSRGDFKAAAEAFKQGFLQETDEVRRNRYLFNMAQSFRLANDCGNAIAFYHRFLSQADANRVSAQARKDVQQFIDEASQACVHRQISGDKPSVGPDPWTPRHESRTRSDIR
jgi:predicted Ser/Thr protein kinase